MASPMHAILQAVRLGPPGVTLNSELPSQLAQVLLVASSTIAICTNSFPPISCEDGPRTLDALQNNMDQLGRLQTYSESTVVKMTKTDYLATTASLFGIMKAMADLERLYQYRDSPLL